MTPEREATSAPQPLVERSAWELPEYQELLKMIRPRDEYEVTQSIFEIDCLTMEADLGAATRR